jgi:hypothetical protein
MNLLTRKDFLDASTVFKGITTAASVVSALRPLIKSSRGIKRGLLMELQSNIQLIFLYTEGGLPIDSVIRKLDTSRCKAALESDFNFSLLKRAAVSRSLAHGVAQFKPYIGWTTEQLFSAIYLKISELQHIVEIDPNNKQFRKGVRLLNVFKLMLLLLRHLRT